MHPYFPPIKPYNTHQIEVESPHTLYVEESGSPEGLPIVIVQDGFGIGLEPNHRRYFDPDIFRIIAYDQRGSGRSIPSAELTHNNTQALLEDLEIIRQRLSVREWIVFGGDWGATLCLLYAMQFPQTTLGLILYNPFLANAQSIEWFYHQGANLIFPDYWQDFLQTVNETTSKHIIRTYSERLNGTDELARMSAAKGWALWHARCATLQPHQRLIEKFTEPARALAMARIGSHYLLNRCFLEEGHIFQHLSRLPTVPCTIVQGRYDVICPAENAFMLNKIYPSSELYLVRDAGHDGGEPGIVDAIVQASQQMAKHYHNHNPTAS